MKISFVERPRRRRLIVEGKLVAPWVAEFATACEKAKVDLHHGRELIVDLRNVNGHHPRGRKRTAAADYGKGQVPMRRIYERGDKTTRPQEPEKTRCTRRRLGGGNRV